MTTVARRTVLATALSAPFIRSGRAAEPLRLRASVDTSPTHGRTQAIADYLKKLEAASKGQIKTQLFDSGQLFADRDVTKALLQGQVEMAAPGTWLLAAFVPDSDMQQLPMFYGQPIEVAHKAIDGRPGQTIDEQITNKLHVKVLGKWIDLGFTNWYSTRKPLNTLEDLKGLKIRNSGGFAQPWRAKFFGGLPNMTAWPDVPLAMSQGTFDALQSTNESVASAKLWDAGLRFGLIDHQSIGDYIPIVSSTFWNKLSPDLQVLMQGLWAANIDTYRANLAAAQIKAAQELKEHGVKLVTVPAAELAEQRKRMIAEQQEVAREMKISPLVLAQIMQAVGSVT